MQAKEQDKKHKSRPFMRRFDPVWLTLLALVIIFLFWRNATRSQTGLVAGVYYKNRLIDVIDLDDPKPRQFSYPQNPAVIFSVRKDGAIAFVASDCPDKVCVHSGYLKRSGDYAACLPNAFVLRVGEKQAIGQPEYRLREDPEEDERPEIQLPTSVGADWSETEPAGQESGLAEPRKWPLAKASKRTPADRTKARETDELPPQPEVDIVQ